MIRGKAAQTTGKNTPREEVTVRVGLDEYFHGYVAKGRSQGANPRDTMIW